jgi:Na+/H+ antiporter NhaD/arsenite permease-like protein
MHLGEIAEILFFLLGAMTIVELIDAYGGFRIITDKIITTSRVKLLWIIIGITFVMSPVFDNMTTTIVMVTLLRKIIANYRERWFYASMIIIAANSGGVWSPIGDVTTIMLWVGGKVSESQLIIKTFPASVVSILVPLIILTFRIKGNVTHPQEKSFSNDVIPLVLPKESLFVLCAGLGALIFVPVFKVVTHLPPYMGMMAGLGGLWVITELMARKNPKRDNGKLSVLTALTRIDTSCVLFFLGILLAVAALQSGGHLLLLGNILEGIPLAEPEKYFVIGYAMGLLSAVVDNVPLVAGAMGMYDFELNHYFWMFLSYCAGAGGSLLIFASAAGVAAMGLEKINFIWYFKKITLLSFIGFTAGALVFILQNYHDANTHTTQQMLKNEKIILLEENSHQS